MRLNIRNTPASAQSILLETQLRFVRYFSISVITILVLVFFSLMLTNEMSLVAAVSFIAFAAVYGLLFILATQQRYTTFLINMVCMTILLSVVTIASPLLVFAFACTGIIVSAIFAHRIVFGVSLFMFFAGIALSFTRYTVPVEFYGSVIGFGATLVLLIGLSLFLRRFKGDIALAVERSVRSSELLRASAEIAQITSNTLDLKALFSEAVELIRDRFDYYHVQIFLLDDARESAVLVASTGEVGQQLMVRGHKLAVGSQSVIGRVTQTGEPVTARDTDHDEVHARNELLPNTRAELALPILDGERIIGALDVQSIRRDAFNDTDLQALQVMSNQLAT
ncbi:MAG: GAF domain-containing protein, partial [Chitinophagaceae bacterium]|nr:GAF domain-containing protein [Anaerolineae bacterium]